MAGRHPAETPREGVTESHKEKEMKKHEITVNHLGGDWREGTIDGVRYQAKVYEEASEEYGLCKSNISKLWIKDVCNYDRGWVVSPVTSEGRGMVIALLAFFKQPENCK